jgi:chromosomal replication initiator protein
MKADEYQILLDCAQELKAQASALESKANGLFKLIRWHDPARKLSVKEIQNLVAKSYAVPLSKMLSRERSTIYVMPRHVAMYLVRVVLKPSLQVIADDFGGLDHGTVINAIERVESLMATEPLVWAKVQNLRNQIEEKLK